MLQTITYNNRDYPILQTEGFAAQYAIPFAKKIIGEGKLGYDIGCNRPEWAYPGAMLIDPVINPGYSAMNLPDKKVDFFLSSHMLEHYVGRFEEVIEYWLTKLNKGGIIFLYLPNCDYQEYWAFGNTKHVHLTSPSMMKRYCEFISPNITRYFVTEGYDLNGSFYCVIEK